MAVNNKSYPITIDLNEFKLHIVLKDRNELTLHFNSPSRKFYLTVIAFVVNEMKKLGKITSIPVETHYDLLALLNNTIGEAAGSSDKEHLLPRIYRKWKDALPNLEEGPLFKVLGKKKEFDEGIAKTYPFTEAEKDNWANLFEYKGSEENVRLKFAIDRIGANLDDIAIIYEDAINGEAWERFISILRDKAGVKPEQEKVEEVHQEPVTQASQPVKIAWSIQYRWAALIVAIVLVTGAATIAIWESFFRHAPQLEVVPKEKIASVKEERSLPAAPPPTDAPAGKKVRVESSPSETRGGSKNPEAYLRSVEANQQILRCTGEGWTQGRRLFEEAIALEPDFSRGYSGLALCYGVETHIQGRANPSYRESMARAIDLAQKAVSLNEKDAINHAVLAYLFALTKQHDKAIVQAERALALEANSFLVLNYSACALMYSCRGKEALAVFERAERLNPSYPVMPSQLSWVYLLLGRYEEAFKQAQKAVERNHQSLFAQLYAQILLATTYNLTGREAEARAAAGKVLVISPNFSVENWQYNLAFKNNDQINLAMNALHKAGLK